MLHTMCLTTGSMQHEAKEDVETQKKNAEKYKKVRAATDAILSLGSGAYTLGLPLQPRFFERVKLMRKLKQAENKLKNVRLLC